MFVNIYPSSLIIIPEPEAVAVEDPPLPNIDVVFTVYSIFIPTIDGKILFAAYTAVSEYSLRFIC